MTATIPTGPLANLRDLGGIAVEGGAVRGRTLFRADDAALIDDAGARALVADGVELIIDLRSPEEVAHTGRGVLAGYPPVHLPLPLTREAAGPTVLALMDRLASAAQPERAMGGWYAEQLRARAGAVVRGIEAIADTPGAVLFHCAAGKDRTGVFAAAVLSVLGADRSDIVADYIRTEDNLGPLLARVAAARPGAGTDADLLTRLPPVLLRAPRGAMEAMLALLDADGGVVEVLTRAGLTGGTVRRLQEKLVS